MNESGVLVFYSFEISKIINTEKIKASSCNFIHTYLWFECGIFSDVAVTSNVCFVSAQEKKALRKGVREVQKFVRKGEKG